MNVLFFDRDLSWLSFNERVLNEAANQQVPLVERIKFLSIFSSNLDEFYRVRIPYLMSSGKSDVNGATILEQATRSIQQQIEYAGKVLTGELIPALKERNIHLVYGEEMPAIIKRELHEYFYASVAAFVEIISLTDKVQDFFFENNKLYQVVITEGADGNEELLLVTVPSDKLPRFFSVVKEGIQFIIFIEDIIREFLPAVFSTSKITGIYNIKITRDAKLDLEDEFDGDLAEKIENKIASRDLGYATRFLYEPGLSLRTLYWLTEKLQLSKANIVRGGRYHNLKDFSAIPVTESSLSYPAWPSGKSSFNAHSSLFDIILEKDRIIHTPYQSYNTVLRFFGEAAIDINVEEIYVTLYRIAGDSKIASALVTAAKNGKRVVVFVELKARFDEANNIRWGKIMKAAGIRIIYSIPNLKVHAKVALVKKKAGDRITYFGLLSTGNLNESTARFYTDHILLTAHTEMLLELEMLFIFLSQKRKPLHHEEISFKHFLVAQFNLQQQFFNLIDNEISNAGKGLPSGITIKLNNLEERKMITRLYEASRAGVPVRLIVRSICCLVPGQQGFSEHIRVTRIVDRYLEHGRVFIFNNNNNELMFLGSADWMNRNIYSRVEVCFPIYDEAIRRQINQIIRLQLADNTQAVQISEALTNIPIRNNESPVRSQEEIYHLLA